MLQVSGACNSLRHDGLTPTAFLRGSGARTVSARAAPPRTPWLAHLPGPRSCSGCVGRVRLLGPVDGMGGIWRGAGGVDGDALGAGVLWRVLGAARGGRHGGGSMGSGR